MRKAFALSAIILIFVLATIGCKKAEQKAAPAEKAVEAPPKAKAEATQEAGAYNTLPNQGVDVKGKKISLGTLNAESGPAAVIGKRYAQGKRILVEAVNSGILKGLPAGWKLELVERDHAYNPQKSVQAYNEIRERVFFLATSFGTPPTLPLLPHLKRDNMVAFPASLSSQMASNQFTPPAGPSYAVEAMRTMDWVVEHAGGANKVNAAIVYQHDDYGKDGLEGWKKAAAFHKVTIVSEQTVAPGQKDMTAVVAGLQKAGANYVLLTVLPSATGPILGTAYQLKFSPAWIGNTPAWLDAFFSGKVLPTPTMANFYWASSLPYWGEDLPGMSDFVAAFNKSAAKAKITPDFYILASYIQGLIELEALKKLFAAEHKTLTRTKFLEALTSIKGWNAGGLIQPIDLTKTPYVVGTRTRVLKPDFEKKSWSVVADYAAPKSLLYAAAPAKAPADSTATKADGATPGAKGSGTLDTGAKAASAPKDSGTPKSAKEGAKAPATAAKVEAK